MSFNSPYSKPEDRNSDSNNLPPNSGYPEQNANPVPYAQGVVQPTGRTSGLSITGFILAIFLPLIGLILSIIALNQTKETGDNKGLAKAGIIVGIIFCILSVLIYALVGAVGTEIANQGLQVSENISNIP